MTAPLGLLCATLVLNCVSPRVAFLVVPEDVGTAFAAIYGFTPRIVIGRDHRFGFGFRLGNHADFQLLYELGPQTVTATLRPPATAGVRSAQQERSRRRPIAELLRRAGWLPAPPHPTAAGAAAVTRAALA